MIILSARTQHAGVFVSAACKFHNLSIVRNRPVLMHLTRAVLADVQAHQHGTFASMNTERCAHCGQELSATSDNFYVRSIESDGLNRICNICAGAYATPRRDKFVSHKSHKQSLSEFKPVELPDVGSVYHTPEIVKRRASTADYGHKNRVLFAMGKIPPEDLLLKMNLQDWRCMYCKDKISFSACHIDHIYPVIKGGEHYLYNIALTCRLCNLAKGKRTLRRFCQVMHFDFEQIVQEIAEINHRLHILVFGEDNFDEEN